MALVERETVEGDVGGCICAMATETQKSIVRTSFFTRISIWGRLIYVLVSTIFAEVGGNGKDGKD